MTKYFTVFVPVKPYVKRFIETHFGLPANFIPHSEEYKLVQKCLCDPTTRYDNKLEMKMCTYTETVEILVSQDIFYRFGWEFTRSDTVIFGKYFERQIKFYMINYISIYIGLGLTIKEAVKQFQEFYQMEEQYWSFESISKHYYRHRPKNRFDFYGHLIQQINQLFVVALSGKSDNFTQKKSLYEINE